MTLDEFKEQHPDLVQQVQEETLQSVSNEAAEAVKAERERIQNIESIEATIADKDLVNKAKYEEPMDAKELAFKAMQQQAKADKELGDKFLNSNTEDVQASHTGDVEAVPNSGNTSTEEEDTEATVMNVLDSMNVLK
jgi:hypothetical protein